MPGRAVTVRPQRTAAAPAVAVTGAAGGLGRALVERLADPARPAGPTAPGVLVGLDRVPQRVDGVVWRASGARDPQLAAHLAGVDVVVHLATSLDATRPTPERRAVNVSGTAHLLDAAAAAGVARVVLVTSAAVWGAPPDDRGPLPDAAPRRAQGGDDSLLSDLVEVERLAEGAAGAGLAITVLRPATLVGGPLGRAYDGPLLRQLAGPRLLALRGVEPQWQLCHTDDLLSALELAALGVVAGPLGVGCAGAMAQRQVEAVTGCTRLELPASVALSAAERLHRLGVTTASPRELDHLLAPLVVAADGLWAAGWRPLWANEEALAAHLASRAADGRGTASTAAGATVALLGTAALVRRARRRRRGRS